MKEIIFNEAPSVGIAIPDAVVARFREVRTSITRRSSIVWGEHCSECAFPACYSACEFYTPRGDMHCRRFMHGIESVQVSAAPDLVGISRVQFRRWGKLEGSGPPRFEAPVVADASMQRVMRTEQLLTQLPLPRAVLQRHVNRINVKRRADTARSAQSKVTPASAFMVEGWLEHDVPICMTLTMLPWDKNSEGLFQTQFTFKQGYNRVVVPSALIRKTVSLDELFAIQIEVVGEVPSQPVVFGLVDFFEAEQPLSTLHDAGGTKANHAKAKTAKCVVWDLDDTVWTGTLVEDGIEGVVLNPHAAEAMRMLDSRGILNSVASKNDEELALAALKHFGLDEFILFPQISWGPKSDAVRRIAEAIDIGIDTFVFVDDQPFERGEVAASHTSITIMTPEDIEGFAAHALFDVPVTEESKKRRFMYRDEEKRQRAASSVGTDYIGFLRSCSIELEVGAVTKDSAERVYELTQRTNQLNVTGARFTRDEVIKFVDGAHAHEGYVLRCRDMFGDYGIIGFCVLNRSAQRIEAFFMSCRVQRKRVEHAFFAWLGQALAGGELTINYIKTAKNGAAVKMLGDLGFELEETTPSFGIFRRDLSFAWPDADIVTVKVGA